ncbi:hypothetical protein Tco_0722872 [Tanacetum coccineum]
MQKSKSYRAAHKHRDLYDELVKSYKLEKDLFESYGKAYSLKRDREDKDKDKDEDPPARSDQGLKKRKTTEESIFESANTKMPHNQGSDLGNTDDQPNFEAAYKKLGLVKNLKDPTRHSRILIGNATKCITFRPPQTLMSKIAKAEKPPLTFDELMSTPIEFSAYVMNNLKINNLTQEHLVEPTFNLLKGICRRQEYPFDLSKPLPLIEDRGRQVVPGITYWGPKQQQFYGYASKRVSKHDVFSTKRIIAVTHVKVMKWYDYGYLEEIEVRTDDQKLYKFKEGDFPRLNLRNIEDMPLLLVQKKISNLEKDVIFELNVAFRMFTRRFVILKRVEDLQLGVKSYQKKLNITKPETFKSDISKRTLYTAYNNPQGYIYVYKFKRNRMDYLLKSRRSNLDKQWSCIMIKAIDKLQLERRLMRNLEKFVGGREYGEDFRLHKQTI